MSRTGRWAAVAVAAVAVTAFSGVPAQAADSEHRVTIVRDRIAGLVAQAGWTTCPAPTVGQVCTDTVVIAADARSRSNGYRDRTPVLRVLTFVYRVIEEDGELSSTLLAEWFGRLEGADVEGRPRLDRARASGLVPVQVCTVVDPTAGLSCPTVLDVSVAWVGQGPLERTAEHVILIRRPPLRIENTWTRGWQRTATATATINGVSPGTLLWADLFRIDQGELVIQHPR